MLRRTILAAVPGALCSAISARAAAPRPTLRVATTHYITMAPFYQAYESGYFGAAGLDIEVTSGTSIDLIPVAAGGKVDVCFFSVNLPFLNAVSRGARIRIVAGREIARATCRPPGVVYGLRKRFPNGIGDLRVLRGKKIAVSGGPGGLNFFCLDMLLNRAGMSSNDVVLMKMALPESIAALESGGVEALVASAVDFRPTSGEAFVRGPSLADIMPNFQYAHIMFGGALLDGDAQTGARFLEAYFHGARDVLAGKSPAYLDELAKSTDADPKAVRAECRDSFVHDGAINAGDLETYIRWAARRGDCPSSLKASDCIDGRFLAAMRKES